MDLVGRARIANGEGACFLRRNHLAVMQGPGVTCESGAMTDAWGNLHIDVDHRHLAAHQLHRNVLQANKLASATREAHREQK